MNETTHLKIGDINKNLICILCGGYYIDATTIIECLHSFCRTCIVTYLKTSKTCPVCDTVVHKTRPHQNIRSDKLLQDLVYKLVPGLYRDEMRRRREFYTRNYDAAPKRPGEERGDEMSDRFTYTEEEKISLALHFCREGASERVDFRRVFTSKEELKARVEKRIKEAVDVRYLQCKAAVTIGHLKKFIRLKYGLQSHFQIEMFYNDEPLRNSCTLCDITYFFSWRRRAPLVLTFCVHESTRKYILGKDSQLMTSSTSAKSQSETKTIIPPIPASEVTLATEKPAVSSYSHSITPKSLPASSTINSTSGNVSSLSSQPTKSKRHKSTKASHSKSVLELSISSLEKAGPCKLPTKTKSVSLGKRPATAPVLIAPAPSKIGTPNSSVMDITKVIKRNIKPHTKSQKTFSSPKLVSLLPVGIPQSTASSAPPCTESVATSSRITFSMSSILKAVPNKNGIMCSSINNKDLLNVSNTAAPNPTAMTLVGPTFPLYLPSSSPTTSSCQAASVKSDSLTSVKTSLLAHNQSSKQLLTSSVLVSSSSSAQSSPLSSSIQTSSCSESTTDSQPSHNSIGSPTPASSASPTPAAMPVQQSQSQGSDVHLTHSSLVTKSVPVPTSLMTSSYQRDSVQVDCYTQEIPELHKLDTYNTHSISRSRNTSKTSNIELGISKIKSETNSIPVFSPTIVTATDSSFMKSMPSHTNGDLNKSVMSPATSPTSNGNIGSCSKRKQSKQKKIADIANTLHKRVSDAFLQMSSRRSSSPNSRRSSQTASPGKKAANILLAVCDLEPSVAQQSRHNVQNIHQNGHLLNSASLESSHNIQSDEPLNLVKGDNNVRHTNGKFILDVPQSLK